MDIHVTCWPDESDTSFDVKLIEAVGEHAGCTATELPTIGDLIDLDAITAIVEAETQTRLAFDVVIPGVGMGVDGEPDTTITVILETGSDEPVHITVTDESRGRGGVGSAPRIG